MSLVNLVCLDVPNSRTKEFPKYKKAPKYMLKLILCVGIPASGKSTWARKYCKEHPNYIRLNRDDLRSMFSTPYSRSLEESVKTGMKNLACLFLQDGYNVIIDDTNFDARTRDKWQIFASENNAQFMVKKFPTPLEECLFRNSQRLIGYVPEPVIYKMYNELKEFVYD